jgi:hypothetical protein
MRETGCREERATHHDRQGINNLGDAGRTPPRIACFSSLIFAIEMNGVDADRLHTLSEEHGGEGSSIDLV